MKKEAILYNKLENNKVECYACARRCKIPENSHGFCFVRQNISGKLHLATYGTVSAMQMDPIEKKPFNHFNPGTYVFGIGTSSCNWGCSFCQNHNISKEKEIAGLDMTPQRIVEMAIEKDTQGIAFTYNEPTIFIEYALDVAKLAHKKGLYTLFVTNGYMTSEAVKEMKGCIDAAVVNFKGNGEQKFSNKYEAIMSSDPIKNSLLEMKKADMHLEMTDLIIPRVGDSLEACDSLTKWICENLGSDIPMQFTRFHGDYKMLDYPSTSFATLKAHYDVAKRNGLNYVYVGNVVENNPYQHTYCPNCSAPVIERDGFYITRWALDKNNKCASCGHKIFLTGGAPKKLNYREITSLY